MDAAAPIDIARLRRSCEECSLSQLCLPAGMDQDDLGRLDGLVQKRRPLQRGDRLFRAGDPLGSVYVASEGAFKTVVINESGEEHVLGFQLPGELFGLDAVGSGRHRCEAIALEESRVCELPFSSLASVASQLPGLQRQLLRVMGQSADRDQDHVGLLSRRQASERVAMFLQGLAHRFHRLGHSAVDFHLPMSRDEIARYLGLALETVSRGFSRLHDDGVIEVRGRRVQVLDAHALHNAANGCEADTGRGTQRRTPA
jgi:CRP/FNR family transcriptional regulator